MTRLEINKPSLDNFITVPELLKIHYDNNPTETAYLFANEGGEEKDADDGLTKISYLEFIHAAHRVAHRIRPARSGADQQVIAMVALADNLVYQATSAGIIHAGFVPILISPRLTPLAVLNLLKVSGAHRVLMTRSTLRDLVRGMEEQREEVCGQGYELSIEEAFRVDDIFPNLGMESTAEKAGDKEQFELYPAAKTWPKPEEKVLYLHSSGSTGLPKAIPLTHYMLWKGYSSIIKEFRNHRPHLTQAGMPLPPFHLMGVNAQFLCPIYAMVPCALYPPSVTSAEALPPMPTPDSVIAHIKKTGANILTTVPSMIQAFARKKESVEVLKGMETLIYGGGALDPTTGSYLVSEGVPLSTVYGASELACPIKLDLKGGFEDWQWNQFADYADIRWDPQGDGTFELQFLTNEAYAPALENLPDARGYATSDLFAPHPSKPGLWRLVGRKDDVLIHSSGEKTVPIPMEDIINLSPLVQGALMFGRERDQAGIIIEPSVENQVDVNDEGAISDFRNKIWPVIEEANEIAPAFSRIYKELVLVLSPGKSLPRAAKGTIMRKAAYKEFEAEINQIYKTVESGGTVVPPSSWDTKGIQQWVTTHVQELSGNSVGVSDDIFENGFDSLSATILRLRIGNALRGSTDSSIQSAAKLLSQNVVYNHPTIESLTTFMVGLANPDSREALDESPEARIERMIEKYSEGLDWETAPVRPTQNGAAPQRGENSVLLTGTTGNLGAEVLASLLANPGVTKVYAFNRSSSQGTMIDRHRERFEDKELDAGTLSSEKLVFLEGESASPKLGLSDAIYEELTNNLTLIIHIAWRLDFNLSLSSFENHIKGTRNLVDLARGSQHASTLRFLFTSSISATQSWDVNSLGPHPETVSADSKVAVGAGYGESKYVTERLLARSGLNASILRIGQVSGGKNGSWSTNDWFPMMIKTSVSMNTLPDAHGDISWVPMDAVSEAMLDVAFAEKNAPLVVNLVHTSPVSWTSVIQAIHKALFTTKKLDSNSLPLVPLRDWLTSLEKAAAGKKTSNELPAAKILDFIKFLSGMDDSTKDGRSTLGVGAMDSLVTDNSRSISPRMRNLEPIGARDAELWVKYWVKHGL